jgi:phosphoribosylamine--glycine ligase
VTVCVVGGGGREHALARLLARADDVVVTPGNPGMPGLVDGHRIRVTAAPPEEVAADLTVIGPEAPLVAGLADRLRARGLPVVGPGADGARLEGSKAFMKEVLAEAGVRTARHGVFDALEPARRFLTSLPGPFVVKTDGLAAGKGVLVAATREEAEADVAEKLAGRAFGEAGRVVVIEEGLAGPECSIHVLCDGTRVAPLVAARDYKRLADGDGGPNTGGMGSVSPLPDVDDRLVDRVLAEAVEPVVAVLRRRGIDYRGVLYAGMMLTAEGPAVLEYNVRFGDPEAQVVLARLADDPVALLRSVAEGRLTGAPASTPEAAVCVVLAAAGYPEGPETGAPLEGLGPDGQPEEVAAGVTVLHAGTARDRDGRFTVAGGRVLGVTAVAPNAEEARRRAYATVRSVAWTGCRYRSDIAAQPAPAAVAR